jgi:hypothetical protein
MYFKDRPNRNIPYEHPRNVSSVRPPLVPEGFYGADEEVVAKAWKDYLMNPWYVGGFVVVIVLLWWIFGGDGKKNHQY